MPLTLASGPSLEQGWPTGERSWLRRRGCITLAQNYMDLRAALAINSAEAPLFELKRPELARQIPGLREGWDFGSTTQLRRHRRRRSAPSMPRPLQAKRRSNRCIGALESARRSGDRWVIEVGSEQLSAMIIVNAAGAWADDVARRCGVLPLGIRPLRRTVVQLQIARSGLRELPLINDALERFYFKGESDNRVWVSPHDETASNSCDASAEELDVATAIDRFESVVDWPIEAVERSWAGLRSFAPDRLPVFGFDSDSWLFLVRGAGRIWDPDLGGRGKSLCSTPAGRVAGIERAAVLSAAFRFERRLRERGGAGHASPHQQSNRGTRESADEAELPPDGP